MVPDQPDTKELDRMFCFCQQYTHIFIYGCEEKQRMLWKYLEITGIRIAGYVISQRIHREMVREGIPIYLPEELESHGFSKDETAFLLALPGAYYNDVLCTLQRLDYEHFFYMSEHNKNTIAYKMRPRIREQFWLEVNIADHCNLNCQMCDHYSQLADVHFLDFDEYCRDIERLSYLMDQTMGIMKLQGGEPLLNRQLGKFIEVTRKFFPHTRIFLFTNGLLLLQSEKWEEGNLWECLYENNVEVELTMYPISLDYEKIQEKAAQYQVKLSMFKEIADDQNTGILKKTSVKHPHDLKGEQDMHSFISCYQFNESITLRHGKIYTCPMIPYSEYLEKAFSVSFERCKDDGIDIYEAKSYEEIAEFVTHRVPFCRYCNVRNRQFAVEWKQSDRTLSEYV